MTQNASFIRKIIYGSTIVVLLFPIFLLGQPATSSTDDGDAAGGRGSTGGILAQMRRRYGLSQAELGKIDPASETMKMATLGLRGPATNILWTKANRYKMTESWDRLSATLNQIAKLQPNYITVWEFQAHNLSFNVSAEFDNYRHRYHWVKKGMDFLIEGTDYNQRNPRLFWNLGWFIGHKIGRSDEQVQFRKMYRTDEEFHNTMVDYIKMDDTRGPGGVPDNWLAAYLWYLKSQSVVDKGVPVTWMRIDVNETGFSDKRRSSVLFYSDPGMSLIGHSDAITNEIEPGEVTRDAWRRAGREWDKFGSMDIPTSFGHTVRLNNLQSVQEDEQKLRAKLEALSPGLREKIREERKKTLTPEELVAFNTEKAPPELGPDERAAFMSAFEKLKVTDMDVAEAMPEQLRARARNYALRSSEANELADRIDTYAMIVNYGYWATRCEVEQSKITADARRFTMLADRAAEEGDPEGARELYEKAWDEWVQIFNNYPQLVDDVMAEDLNEVIFRYKMVLDQLDEGFPKDFKLRILMDEETFEMATAKDEPSYETLLKKKPSNDDASKKPSSKETPAKEIRPDSGGEDAAPKDPAGKKTGG